MGCYSMDVGTFNLVTARKGEKEGEIKFRKEVNAFIELSLENRYSFNMLKKAGVALIEQPQEQLAYIIGEAALSFAHSMPNLTLRKSMSGGCLNPQERYAHRVLSIMLHSLIGEVDSDQSILYYSVPANAVNEKTDADYHQKVLEDIFKKYKVNNKTIKAYPMNEALAIIYAELADTHYTGLSASFGGGMINVCYSILSHPVFCFSVQNSGDWIDEHAAKVSGEQVSTINKVKHSIDLTKAPQGNVERAIVGQYKIMVEKTMVAIKNAILEAGNKVRVDNPIPFVISGGTASPNGFKELVTETINDIGGLSIPLGKIIKPEDNLYSVAKGLYIAATNSQ